MSYQLPSDHSLPIHLLAACFNNTSATYKFYWLLSIIEEVENGKTEILKHDLFAGMVSLPWYTVNYFHVSFGVQDQIQRAIRLIAETELIAVQEKRKRIKEHLSSSTNLVTAKALNYFDGEVPHRFLSPWFATSKGNKREVYLRSQAFENDCLYALTDQKIIVNPRWVNYLRQNSGILKSFCWWNLSLYLQKHNPSVPDIAGKLIQPIQRKQLSKQRLFWNRVINEVGSIDCIYTGKKLSVGNYAVEHFVPYAFVSHDLIWNLIPADRSFNSIKSDRLPSMDRFFVPFYSLQKVAVEVLINKYPKERLLEEYLTIFPQLYSDKSLSQADMARFRETIDPLITIAGNNGFEFLPEESYC